MAAACGSTMMMERMDARTGHIVMKLEGHEDTVLVGRQGQHLSQRKFTIGMGRQLRIWPADDSHNSSNRSLAVSPLVDSARFATS